MLCPLLESIANSRRPLAILPKENEIETKIAHKPNSDGEKSFVNIGKEKRKMTCPAIDATDMPNAFFK